MTAQTLRSTPARTGRFGRALRKFAQIYADARLMQARWDALSQIDPQKLQAVDIARHCLPPHAFTGSATTPASANDDRETRRVA